MSFFHFLFCTVWPICLTWNSHMNNVVPQQGSRWSHEREFVFLLADELCEWSWQHLSQDAGWLLWLGTAWPEIFTVRFWNAANVIRFFWALTSESRKIKNLTGLKKSKRNFYQRFQVQTTGSSDWEHDDNKANSVFNCCCHVTAAYAFFPVDFFFFLKVVTPALISCETSSFQD